MEKNSDYYYKDYDCGGCLSISRYIYEKEPPYIDTSSLSDDDMQRLADAIKEEMEEWYEMLEEREISKRKFDKKWWDTIEDFGFKFGMTYKE